MNDDALRDTLRDPSFDEGVAPGRLLAAVHAREERLLRRRRTVAAVAAAVTTVGVLAGAAALTMRPDPVMPAAPPSSATVQAVTPAPSATPAPTSSAPTTTAPSTTAPSTTAPSTTTRTSPRQAPGPPPSAVTESLAPPPAVTVAPRAAR